MLNPNGPLLNGGSHGDNGQTGRKLVMDYYGPRVPIGGGALCGKDFAHIDRAAAMAAREAAVEAVRGGARECKVVLAYAPNVDEPVEVGVEGIGVRDRFRFGRGRFGKSVIGPNRARPIENPYLTPVSHGSSPEPVGCETRIAGWLCPAGSGGTL